MYRWNFMNTLYHSGMKIGVGFSLFSFSLYLIVGLTWTAVVEIGGALCDSSNPAYSIASNTGDIQLPITFDNVRNNSSFLTNVSKYHFYTRPLRYCWSITLAAQAPIPWVTTSLTAGQPSTHSTKR